MNNLKWYGGLSLKKAVDGSGRYATTAHWLVAAFLRSQEEGTEVKEMIRLLKEISTYDPQAVVDRDKALKELGF
jgi:hypothetical protein